MPQHDQKIPLMALLLGWGGVLPFVGAALAKIFGGPVIDLYALSWGSAYAGVIITFIGAVHWGAAMGGIAVQHPEHKKQIGHLIWSVLPALAVWPVMTLPPLARLPFLIVGLLIVWAADMLVTKRGHLPRWYMKLRHGLTVVATGSMLTLGLA